VEVVELGVEVVCVLQIAVGLGAGARAAPEITERRVGVGDTPPSSRPESVDRPVGSAEELEKVFLKTS
jgi:hypothetical protein